MWVDVAAFPNLRLIGGPRLCCRKQLDQLENIEGKSSGALFEPLCLFGHDRAQSHDRCQNHNSQIPKLTNYQIQNSVTSTSSPSSTTLSSAGIWI